MSNTMNLNDSVRRMRSISFALNNLEVKGRENLDILLGSIQALDKLANDMEKGLKEMEEPEITIDVVEADSD